MRLRELVAAGLIVALLAALTLASSPRLHEQLHPGTAQHECAAVLFASGNCEQSASPTSAPEIADAPVLAAPLMPTVSVVAVGLRSSILEHAPPRAL